MSSDLVLHCGARTVTEGELQNFHAPPPQGRWYPLAHGRVLDVVKAQLTEAGYAISAMRLGVSQEGHRFFGTLDLTAPITPGVTLAVGLRNSTDKSFPLGFCAGNRVFVCDNLSFRSELLVRKKHTLNGERNYIGGIADAVMQLAQFREMETRRVELLTHRELLPDQADALILRAYERGVVGARELPKVLHEWRNPEHPEFEPRTAWSLLNAFTAAMRQREVQQPARFARQTMQLNGLLETSAT